MIPRAHHLPHGGEVGVEAVHQVPHPNPPVEAPVQAEEVVEEVLAEVVLHLAARHHGQAPHEVGKEG
jgi:hypothetical protein